MKLQIEAPIGTHYVTISTDGKVTRVPFDRNKKVDWAEFNKILAKLNKEGLRG